MVSSILTSLSPHCSGHLVPNGQPNSVYDMFPAMNSAVCFPYGFLFPFYNSAFPLCYIQKDRFGFLQRCSPVARQTSLHIGRNLSMKLLNLWPLLRSYITLVTESSLLRHSLHPTISFKNEWRYMVSQI